MYKKGICIGSIIVICLGTSFGVLSKASGREFCGVEEQIMHQEVVIERNKQEQLLEFTKQIIDEDTKDEVAVVDHIVQSIETDQCNRYLVEMQVLALNVTGEPIIYDYCLVIQQDEEGGLYILPQGVEVLINNDEPIKRDLTVSMIKMTNNWGRRDEDKGSRLDQLTPIIQLENVHDAQKAIKLVNDYVNEFIVAINTKDNMKIDNVYTAKEPGQEEQCSRMDYLKDIEATINLFDFNVLKVECSQELEETSIDIQSTLRVYQEGRIKTINITATFKIIEQNGQLCVSKIDVKIKE